MNIAPKVEAYLRAKLALIKEDLIHNVPLVEDIEANILMTSEMLSEEEITKIQSKEGHHLKKNLLLLKALPKVSLLSTWQLKIRPLQFIRKSVILSGRRLNL